LWRRSKAACPAIKPPNGLGSRSARPRRFVGPRHPNRARLRIHPAWTGGGWTRRGGEFCRDDPMGGASDQQQEITITGRRSFFLDQHAIHVQRISNSARLLSYLLTLPLFIIDTLSVTALVAIATILLARGQDLQSSLLLLGIFRLGCGPDDSFDNPAECCVGAGSFSLCLDRGYLSRVARFAAAAVRPSAGSDGRRPPSRSDRRSRSNMCPIFS
jgi:hypothetical protein